MKTAISIPDDMFRTAETFARQRRMSRSALFTKAVTEFFAHHRRENVTKQLNCLYEKQDSALDAAVRTLQALSVPREKW